MILFFIQIVFDFFCLKSPDMSLFKKNKASKGKNPSEVVKSMREALTNLEKAGGNEKTIQKVCFLVLFFFFVCFCF